LSAGTTASDLVRAVLEGVAYNSRWLNGAVERFARRRLDPLRIFGGGAQSDLWCQIYADIHNRTIQRVANPACVNLRGAALIAAVGLGLLSENDVPRLVPIERTFTPNPDNRAIYDRLYAEFARLYKRERKMFVRLNRNSG
jgi:xylulokinase